MQGAAVNCVSLTTFNSYSKLKWIDHINYYKLFTHCIYLCTMDNLPEKKVSYVILSYLK